MAAPGRHLGTFFGAAAVVVVLDQLTKQWALSALADGPIDLVGSLRLNLVFNDRAAFSLGFGSTTAIALVGCALVVGPGGDGRAGRAAGAGRSGWASSSAARSATSPTGPSGPATASSAGGWSTWSTSSGGRCSTWPTPRCGWASACCCSRSRGAREVAEP